MTSLANSEVIEPGSRSPNPCKIKHQMDLGVTGGQRSQASREDVCVCVCAHAHVCVVSVCT